MAGNITDASQGFYINAENLKNVITKIRDLIGGKGSQSAGTMSGIVYETVALQEQINQNMGFTGETQAEVLKEFGDVENAMISYINTLVGNIKSDLEEYNEDVKGAFTRYTGDVSFDTITLEDVKQSLEEGTGIISQEYSQIDEFVNKISENVSKMSSIAEEVTNEWTNLIKTDWVSNASKDYSAEFISKFNESKDNINQEFKEFQETMEKAKAAAQKL